MPFVALGGLVELHLESKAAPVVEYQEVHLAAAVRSPEPGVRGAERDGYLFYFGVDGGVLVLTTPAGNELKPDDMLRRIDGADIASAAEAYRLLWRIAEDAEVEVRRKNRTLKVTMPAVERSGPRHETDVKVIEMEIEKQ